MSRVLGYLLRFAVILIGYIAASLAASAFIHLIFLASVNLQPQDAPWVVTGSLFFSVPFVALFVAYFVFFPSAVIICIAEILGRRDWLFYALSGGGVAVVFLGFAHKAADPDFVLTAPTSIGGVIGAGMVGGLAYWLVAGRWSGSWRGDEGPDLPISHGPSES